MREGRESAPLLNSDCLSSRPSTSNVAKKMTAPSDYIDSYSPEVSSQIEFDWNGKHADEFEDKNQEFRQSVVSACLEEPTLASTILLKALFIEEAKWAREAWGSPRGFGELGQLLLQRGDEDAVRTFASGMNFSFDTFGACHAICLSSDEVQTVTQIIDRLLEGESDEDDRGRLESAKELLTKIAAGSATDGWATVAPGTPVSNISIVRQPLLHRLWTWLTT